MSETRKHVVAVLFADLSRASGQDAEGDKSAHDVIEYWISRTTELLAQENANLITSVGSTVRCAFPAADQAITAACLLQQETMARLKSTFVAPPELRIGLNVGDVVVQQGAYAGETLMMAARMALLAKPRQIIASQTVNDTASPGVRQRLTRIQKDEEMHIRLGPTIEVYEVRWRDEGPAAKVASAKEAAKEAAKERHKELTHKSGAVPTIPVQRLVPKQGGVLLRKAAAAKVPLVPAADKKPGSVPLTPKKVELRPASATQPVKLCVVDSQGNTTLVGKERPSATMGRSDDNDIVFAVDSASRKHAQIEYRAGEFYLIDHSWNGTLVYDSKENQEVLVHNDEFKLPASGSICLGCQRSSGALKPLEYRLVYG